MESITASDTPKAQTVSRENLFVRTVRRLLLCSAYITSVDPISPNFVRIDFAGDDLKNVPWTPGQHIQVFCNGLTHRTYTPVFWDAESGRSSFLVYLHGGGPGCQWARDVQQGDMIQFNGPSRSLEVPDFDRPLILFGDETSFGLAMALGKAKSSQFHAIFEVSDLEASQAILKDSIVRQPELVRRSEPRTHLQPIADELLRSVPKDSYFALTGNARSIQVIKKRLHDLGEKPANIRVKPYWVEGKTGLE